MARVDQYAGGAGGWDVDGADIHRHPAGGEQMRHGGEDRGGDGGGAVGDQHLRVAGGAHQGLGRVEHGAGGVQPHIGVGAQGG